jgi:hypothetical protein
VYDVRFDPDNVPVIRSIFVGVATPEESTRSIVIVISVVVGSPVTEASVIVSPVPVPIPADNVVENRLLYFRR